MRKPTRFLSGAYTNQAVQPLKMARGWNGSMKIKACKKKNPSYLQGMDRQICPSVHSLAQNVTLKTDLSIHTQHSCKILILLASVHLLMKF